MALTILDNIPAVEIENDLNRNQADARKNLTELATGSRINSGADDAAGLSISDSLAANVAALQQSALNAQQGIELLQTADSALAEASQLLDRMTALAVERNNGSLYTAAQQTTLADEYNSLLRAVTDIGSEIDFNGQRVFGPYEGVGGQHVYSIVTGDGTASGTTSETLRISGWYSNNIGDSTGDGGYGEYIPGIGDPGYTYLEQTYGPSWQISYTRQAVQDVSTERAYFGAEINKLQATEAVDDAERINLSEAQNNIQAADFGKVTADLVRESVLNETAVSALKQPRANQESVLQLLR